MTMSGYMYKASRGETWDIISLSVYGSERYVPDLLCANPGMESIMVFEGGEQVMLPVVTDTTDTESDAGAAEPMTAPWKE